MSKKTLKEEIQDHNQPASILNAIEEGDVAVIVPGAKVLKTGLQILGEMTFENWVKIGKSLGRFRHWDSFSIGDWLNYGEAVYGEKYSQGMEVTGLEPETLCNTASVCSKVENSRRRENLPFAHHVEVAKLSAEDQTKWLDISEKEGLNRKELRASIKAQKVVRIEPAIKEESGEKNFLTIQYWVGIAVRWIKKAIAKQDPSEWPVDRIKGTREEMKEIVKFDRDLASLLIEKGVAEEVAV